MREPTVAVLIPVYNAERFVRDALLSVLAQRGCEFRVIVVDDGCTDRSVEAIEDLCRDPRVTLIRQRNMGKPATINRVVANLDADIVVLNDADDLSHPDRVAVQRSAFARETDLAVAYCGYELLIGSRRMARVVSDRSCDRCRSEVELFRMPGHDATAAYRVDVLRRFPLAEDLPIGEGLDLALRIGEHHPMRVIGQCLLSYRVHPASITRSDPLRRMRLIQEALRRACVRREIDFDATPFSRPVGGPAAQRTSDGHDELFSTFSDSVVGLRIIGRTREAIRTALDAIALRPISMRRFAILWHLLAPLTAIESRWRRKDYALRAALSKARIRRD